MYQNNKKKQKITNFHCPKCGKNINRTLGIGAKNDYCDRCEWKGRLCRTCGNEKRIRAFRKTKIKDGRKYKSAIARFGHECKLCKAEKIRKELEEARKRKRLIREKNGGYKR